LKQIETDIFTIYLHDDLLKEIIVKKNKTLTEEDIHESIRLSQEAIPGKQFYVLIEGEENASVAAHAQGLAASSEYAKFARALALCSADPYLEVAGSVYLKTNHPKIPTRFFERRSDAIDWLRSLMNKGIT
jgi:hypothetical protein